LPDAFQQRRVRLRKLEIIRTVETSFPPVRRTLAQIGIPKSTKLSVVGSIPIARSKT